MYDITKELFYRKPSAPCRYCADRVVGCHGICKKYADWVEKEHAVTEQIMKTKESDTAKKSCEINGMKRRKGHKT